MSGGADSSAAREPDFGIARDFYTFAPELLGDAVPEFEIVREVGKGSMGIVYEARRKRDGVRVALKVLPPSLTLTEQTLARFLREGRVMARIEHPDIVRCLGQGSGIAGGARLHWFAMEFVDGVTLQERLQVGPLPVQRACAIAARVGRALQFAHERGVVHRDVKPGNVMVRDDGTLEHGDAAAPPRVAITDFGLARETGTGSMTESGAIVGTPMYMAPEQVIGGSAHAGTLGDVYGLGATLYTLLCGQPPFDGPTAQSVLRAVVDDEPLRPRRLRSDLPRAVEAIVLKAMAKEPRDRYGSAQEMAEDLERWLAGDRVLARLPGPLVRATRQVAAHPLLATLVLLVVALGTGAFLLERERRAQLVQQHIAEAENWLAQAATTRDAQSRQRTADERRELLLAAVSAATDAVARDDGSPMAHFVRAKAWHRLRRLDEALQDLDAAERLLGGPTPELLHFRIDTLRQRGDAASIRSLQHDLTRLLALDPGPGTRTLVAEHLLEISDQARGLERSEALMLVRDVLRPVGADDPRGAVLGARLLEAEGAIDEALAAMRATRRRHEGNVYVHLQAAALYERLGLHAECTREQEMARLLEPDAADSSRSLLDLEGLGSFLGDVNALLQSLEPAAPPPDAPPPSTGPGGEPPGGQEPGRTPPRGNER